jgi:hypothetical protein
MVGLTAWLTLALGCGQPAADNQARRAAAGPSTGAASEVARVNGASIDVAEVQRVVTASHVEPTVALQRLIGEQLLVEEAARRGFDRRAGVAHTTQQAAVQALLTQEIEHHAPSDDEITSAYEAQRERFLQPERRKSLHVLVSLKRSDVESRRSAAERLVLRIVQELSASPAPRAVWERYRTLSTLEGFTIKAEELPAVSRADPYAPEYLEGLFARAQPGVVPTPMLTDFGWHAIVVTEITPAQATTLEQARETLRKELATAQRKAAVDAMIAATRAKHRVVPNQPVIEALLHADEQALGLSGP